MACVCEELSLIPDHFQAFTDVRGQCPALGQVLIPDSLWPDYQRFCLGKPDEARHASITWLAFRRCLLPRITSSIHRFILEGNVPRVSVTQQYLSDLPERWFLKPDVMSRYEAARRYQGRLAELRFARWLEQQHWSISQLEAYGGEFDIEAKSPEGSEAVMEVKFLGEERGSFISGVQAIQHGISSGWSSLYSPLDYLVYRIYEAAIRLNTSSHRRIAVVILSRFGDFSLQLEGGWIDWKNPRFFRADHDIKPFLDERLIENPHLERELPVELRKLNNIWILSDSSELSLSLKYDVEAGG